MSVPSAGRECGKSALDSRSQGSVVAQNATQFSALGLRSRARTSYLRAQFYRIRARRGPKKAIGAVAASMLTAIYYILRDNGEYRDLGSNHLDTLDRSRLSRRLVRRLENMGYHVELSNAA
jgi:hypothetical protein